MDGQEHIDPPGTPKPGAPKPATIPLSALDVDRGGMVGRQMPYRYDEFDRKFFGSTREFRPKVGADNATLTAQDQSGWEQAGLFFGNLVPNIAGNIIENVGYLGALGTEWGDDRDYNNALTELGKSMRNPAGNILRERPNEVWDPSDPAWWYQSAGSLVESASAFAITGYGMGAALSWIPKAVKALGAGASWVRGGRALQHLGTAAGLAYTEGAMSGARVFDTTYQVQYKILKDQGVPDEVADAKARHIASQSAAATVQLNTIVNTGLNLTAVAPLFRHTDDIKDWWRTAGKIQPGEKYSAWAERIKNLNVADADIAKLFNPRGNLASSMLREMGQEGAEELVNQWAEARGMERGKQGKELNGLRDLLGDAEHFFNDTMNEEGSLNFVLGAVGGAAQTALIDNIPLNKVHLDQNGNITDRRFEATDPTTGVYQTKMVSARYKNALGGRNYFENVKDSVVKDIDRVKELNDQLEKAVIDKKPLDIERTKMKMFDAGAISAVTLGIGDAFAKQYANIRDLDNETSLHEAYDPELKALEQQIAQTQDPAEKKALQDEHKKLSQEAAALVGVTEAMQKGFAKDMNDNAYKEKATKAIKDIKYYEDLWQKLDKKYRNGDEWDGKFADYLFSKTVDVKRRKDIIADAERDIAQAEANRAAILSADEDAIIGPVVSDIVADVSAREAIVQDAKEINKALFDIKSNDEKRREEGEKILKEKADKYLPNAESESDLESATGDVVKQLNAKIKEIDDINNKRIEDLRESEEYKNWVNKKGNEKKDFADFLKSYRRRTAEDQGLEADKAELAEFKRVSEIAESNLGKLTSRQGKSDYIEKAKATQNKLLETIKEKSKKDNENTIHRLTDSTNAAVLDDLQRDQLAEMLELQRETKEKQLAAKTKEYNELIDKMEAIKKPGLINQIMNAVKLATLARDAKQLSREMYQLKKQIEKLTLEIEALTKSNINTHVIKPNPSQPKQTKQPGQPKPVSTLPDFLKNMDSQLRTELAALPIIDEEFLLMAGQTIVWDALTAMDHPITQLPPNDQTPFRAEIDAYVKQVLQDYNKVPTAGTTTPDPDPLQELVTVIDSAKISQKKKAEILADLAEYKRLVDVNHTSLSNIKTAAEYLDARGHVGKGKLSKKKAEEISDVFAKVHNIVYPTKQTTPAPKPKTTKPKKTKVKSDDIPEQSQEDSNEGQSLDQDPNDVTSEELQVLLHQGQKVTNAAKVNTLTHNYEQDIVKDDDNDLLYVNKSDFTLNEYVNPLYVTPGAIKEGAKLMLVIDTDWTGTVNDTQAFTYGAPAQKKDNIFMYMDNDRAISMDLPKVGNVPIKIVDVASGTTIGYLPRVDWITAMYPNMTNDYRNVANEIYDEEGNLVEANNVQKEFDRIMFLRKKIATAYNNGMKQGLPSTIMSRSKGHALRVFPQKASEMLPDESLPIVLAGKESVKMDAQTPVDAVLPDYISAKGSPYAKRNIPGVLVPDASGKKHFEPLWVNRLGKAEVDTVIRAVEIYLTLSNPHVKQEVREKAEDDAKFINETTGYDLNNHMGLKGFINQFYFYTRGYNDQEVAANAEALGGKPRVPEFRLAIAESIGTGFSKALIKAGVTFMGKSVKANVNADGVINLAFAELLHDDAIGLQSKFRNVVFERTDVGIRGINSPGALTEVVFQPGTKNFRTIPYKSYNDMIKQNSMTTLYGKLKLNDGTYVYFANPVTNFDYETTMKTDVFVAKKPQASPADIAEKQPDVTVVEEPTKKEEVAGLTQAEIDAENEYLDNLTTNADDESYSGYRTPKEVVNSAGQVVGTPLSIENLEELRNFTPVENRNNLSPAEAMEQMVALGLTVIAPGYNPFYSC